MNSRRLAILMALALGVLCVAFWLSRPRTLPRDPDFGAPVLAGLAAHLDAVSAIRVIGPGAATLVTLERQGSHWRVREADYPADAARVKRLLIALGELHVLEPKTDDPKRHAALGVEDPAEPNATSLRVELDGLEAPVAVIVGHAAGTQGSYVRIPGTAQALEARPALEVGRTPRDWLSRGILDVAAARVAEVDIARTDGPAWKAERREPGAAHFSVPDLPRGKELTSAGAADGIASAFGNLEFDEVRAALPAAGKRGHEATLYCYDGLVVTLLGTDGAGPDHWLTVSARFDPAVAGRYAVASSADTTVQADRVRQEADRINALAAGHEYKLASYRFDGIFRQRSELLRH